MTPRVFVCFGTGGVGKTTLSAALASALSWAGQRTLVMTFDPARRLADAFGVRESDAPVQITERLWAYMPAAEESARRTVEILFGAAPARARLLADNPVLATLKDGLAGMHELGAMAELVRLAPDFDTIVIDTPPSRHALGLLELPRRLAALVDSRALSWLGEAAAGRAKAAGTPRGLWTRLFDFGQARLLAELEGTLGGAPVAACVELVLALTEERAQLSALAAQAEQLLCGEHTRYVLVGTPREGALAELVFFHDRLAALARAPSWLVLNRFVAERPRWPHQLAEHPRASAGVRAAAEVAGAELGRLADQSRALASAAAERFPHARLAPVPRLDARHPAEVVAEAALALARAGLAPMPGWHRSSA